VSSGLVGAAVVAILLMVAAALPQRILRRPPTVLRGRRAAPSVTAERSVDVAAPHAAIASLATASTSPSTRHLRRHRWRGRRHHASTDLPDAVDLLIATVRAGELPRDALRIVADAAAATVRPAFDAAVQQLDSGVRFADAVHQLDALGPHGVAIAGSLAAAENYGLPLEPVLAQLAAESRQARRRAVETRARELPTRMALPLVLCTLPSFVVLAVVPLLLGALSSIQW
jgi:pilus assembly protein TadC